MCGCERRRHNVGRRCCIHKRTMWVRMLSGLLPLCFTPTYSFMLPPTSPPYTAACGREPLHDCNFNSVHGRDRCAPSFPERGGSALLTRVDGYRMSTGLGLSSAKRRLPKAAEGSANRRSLQLHTTLSGHPEQLSAGKSALDQSTSVPEELPDFLSNEGVSYWVHSAKASNIWLVGVVHGTETGVQLVEEVIGGIKPEVVMVELDVDRISLLPPGEAVQTKRGLWWWNPEKRQQSAGEIQDDVDGEDEEEDATTQGYSEITAAVREAGASGARVLLGDREYKSTARLLEKAKLVDMASAKEREEFNELTSSFDCGEESTREITRKECQQMKAKAPKVFSVMCTQRDQIFAKHLMKLRGNQTTVAVFGMAHLDGVEKILKGNGWKRQRA